MKIYYLKNNRLSVECESCGYKTGNAVVAPRPDVPCPKCHEPLGEVERDISGHLLAIEKRIIEATKNRDQANAALVEVWDAGEQDDELVELVRGIAEGAQDTLDAIRNSWRVQWIAEGRKI